MVANLNKCLGLVVGDTDRSKRFGAGIVAKLCSDAMMALRPKKAESKPEMKDKPMGQLIELQFGRNDPSPKRSA
ncbi:hypothetical protein JKY72_06940 [Candidatus Gracilibacteria bacterium]|nr:hypothetical protein [Candidatus Gracilibacteria bacterium]